MHGVLLAVHVACGALGLVAGPAAMLAPKRRGLHVRAGAAYQVLTIGLCVSALGLVAYRHDLWWLAVIAVATEATTAAGWLVARRRRGDWVPLHLSLTCGSYVSFVTAFLVVNAGIGAWYAWVLPTLVGTPLIARTAARAGVTHGGSG